LGKDTIVRPLGGKKNQEKKKRSKTAGGGKGQFALNEIIKKRKRTLKREKVKES